MQRCDTRTSTYPPTDPLLFPHTNTCLWAMEPKKIVVKRKRVSMEKKKVKKKKKKKSRVHADLYKLPRVLKPHAQSTKQPMSIAKNNNRKQR